MQANEFNEEEARKLIPLCIKLITAGLKFGKVFLASGGKAVVFSQDTASLDSWFLKTGEAAAGDWIVAVPGCYHYLVLRWQGNLEAKGRCWKLVGLMATVTLKAEGVRYPESEWRRLLKEGDVKKYTIV